MTHPEHAGVRDVPPSDDHWPDAPPPDGPFAEGPGGSAPFARSRRSPDRDGSRDREQHGRDFAAGAGGGFERVPPQDLDAEQSVLGGMLLSKDAIADVVEVIKGHDFYRPAHETIFGAILDLYAKGEPADPITVAAELVKRGEITRVGGAPYLHSLVSMVPTAANAEYYAEIVHERAVLRRLVEAGTRITQMGYAADGDVDEIVNSAQAEIYAVTEQRTSEDYAPLADIMEGALDEIEAIGSRSGQMSGVPTGFTDLDSLTNGLHPGQMIVVAARPAMGKCVASTTVVVEAGSGRAMTVEELVGRGARGEAMAVHTLGDDWKLTPVRPSAFHCNGVKPVFRLTTELGRTLRATANHPLRTLRGWVPMEDLLPGDRIAVPLDHGTRKPALAGEPDLLPADVWSLVEAEKGELDWAALAALTGRPLGRGWAIGRELDRHVLMELAKVLHSRPLLDLADSDIRWDRVVSVRSDGQDTVYDLTVDGTHNFVADGVVVHNSTLALDFARACSIRNAMPSVIFSLEMGRNEIAMRLLSAEARVALHHMRSGSMTDDDWTRLARRMPEVTAAPLYIDDSPNLTMMEIRAKCRRLKQRNDLRMVVIDYLQLMQSGGSRRPESRQQEVSEMSRNLKLLAKELEVPVIALSQLNRGPEQRTDKKPMVSDLRESGCVTAGTRVLRADTGAEVTMGELLERGERDVPVWSLDERLRLVPRAMSHVFRSGVKEVFRLTLASGREIEATANHPFLTHGGWRPLGALAPGSRIAVPRRTRPPSAGAEWPQDEVVMLAHLLGGGSVGLDRPVRCASSDEGVLAAVEHAARHFGVTPRRIRRDARWEFHLTGPGTSRSRSSPQSPSPDAAAGDDRIARWLDKLGLYGRRAHERFLPPGVFGLGDSQIGLFLRHLWASGGSVTITTAEPVRVSYPTTSERLARDVQLLLLRLGIGAVVRSAGTAKGRPRWTVDVSGVEDRRRFLERVGMHGAGEDDVVAAGRRPAAVDTAGAMRAGVPHDVWQSVESAVLGPPPAAGAAGSVRLREVAAPKDGPLARVAAILEDASLELVATSDVFWDEVISVESVGEQEVYDATVPGTHNFVANGVHVHNSIEQDADMVILLHREDAYEKESPRAGEADLIVAKHRNGPTATITVAFQGHYSRFVDMAVT